MNSLQLLIISITALAISLYGAVRDIPVVAICGQVLGGVSLCLIVRFAF